jgi:cytochrome c
MSLAVLTDGRLASGGADGKVKLWPEDGGGEPVLLAHASSVEALAVMADGRLASADEEGKIKLWPKRGTGEPLVLSHGSEVRALAALADGRLASVATTARSSCGPMWGRVSRWSSRMAARSGP